MKMETEDRSVIQNSKTAPVSTQIDGVTFPPASSAREQNDALAEHLSSQPAETVVQHITPHSSPEERAAGAGGIGGNHPVNNASGGRVTGVTPTSDAARPTWASSDE